MGLLACHTCGTIVPPTNGTVACPRCGTAMHPRKPHSLTRTWAFLLAAYICYLPANLLPVMETQSIFGAQHDTIFSGVVYLWLSDAKLLAIVVLVASIVVPLMKLLLLTALLLTVHFRSTCYLGQLTHLHAFVEKIGRWSMPDIFVVALLASLVQVGPLATISPRSGTLAYCAVVIFSMMASSSFDTRLLWDSAEPNDARR
ncbi:paraquat-inducible membrane protein A [Cupriavidus pauculus]|uniref:Paraquat-inducible membrane protein A n=2 Tax=Cupriavidus pauculus TaxID=82633 RepID=A0A2N5C3F2_9BURK|nr:paraquat-inducible membrane protein A [Cupriavidus pauculus]